MAKVKDFAAQREFKERVRTSASSSLVSAAIFAVSLCAFGKNVACTHNDVICTYTLLHMHFVNCIKSI